jgi:hypothetical protein
MVKVHGFFGVHDSCSRRLHYPYLSSSMHRTNSSTSQILAHYKALSLRIKMHLKRLQCLPSMYNPCFLRGVYS